MYFFSTGELQPFRLSAVLILLLFCGAVGYAQDEPKFHQNVPFDPRLTDFNDYRYQQPPVPDAINNLTAPNVSPTAGELDTSFNSEIFSAPGNARATAVQPDGKILVGGYFRNLNGIRRDSLVRLNADNTIDATLTARVNSTILAIAVQADGKIVISGAFTAVNGVARNGIARLNADGSLDNTFNPGFGADGLVYSVAVQADGKIVLGGNFRGVNGTANFAVVRLNADGSPDSSFISPIPAPSPFPNPTNPPQPPSVVFKLIVQLDGKIVLGGFIVRSYEPTFTFTSVARLNSNGTFDPTFTAANFNSSPFDIALQSDGKIVAGGFFTTVGGVSRNYVARLNANGSLDNTFNPGTGADSIVYTINVQTDGAILIGGRFRNFNGTPRTSIARLNTDGSLDPGFGNSNVPFYSVYGIAPTASGKVVTAGSNIGFNTTSRNTILFFNANGSIDSASGYDSTALGGVRAVVSQPDGKSLVGGFFNRVNGLTRNGLARLNADGSPDSAFGSTFSTSSSLVNTIVLQPDGKILVGGINVASVNSNLVSIARYNSDGTLDNSFVQGELPLTNRGVRAIALQANGKIVIIYDTTNNQNFPSSGVARLNNNGSIDASFNSTLTSSLETIVVQPDEKVLAGGPFGFCFVDSRTGTVCYLGAVRLNADGTLDTTFRTNFSTNFSQFSRVYALTLLPDGNILAGGSIYGSGSTVPTGVVRLNSNGIIDSSFNVGSIASSFELARVEDLQVLPNGKIVIGGLFNNLNGTAQSNVARLNPNGSLDATFQAATDNTVYDVGLQTNGKILLGGDFETVNNTPRTVVARLLSEPVAPRPTLFDFDGDGRADVSVVRQNNWLVQRSSQGFFGVQFGTSTDKLVPADFDGDGKTDVAVFRDGFWYWLNSSNNSFNSAQFGVSGDVPLPADYTGDGRADLAVYRNGFWYTLNLANNQFQSIQFGVSSDKPVPADFDGDGKTDVSVYRDGSWLYLQSSDNGFRAVQFGAATDKPVVGDYDGDGKADPAVFRDGFWYVFASTQGFFSIQFGVATDKPVPADYDGDGKIDPAVFRDGNWYLLRSAQGFAAVPFGVSSDTPIPNTYLPL